MGKKKQIKISADEFRKIYKYDIEPELTAKLDDIGKHPMSIEDIYKITLWKVGRFPHFNDDLLVKLNNLSNLKELDEKLTCPILKELLNCKGVRLPMASTYLRFRNPKVFQIIDRHVWYQVYKGNENGINEEYEESNDINKQIEKYFNYLHDLRELAKKDNVDFTDADRFYFMKDKAEGHIIGKTSKKQR